MTVFSLTSMFSKPKLSWSSICPTAFIKSLKSLLELDGCWEADGLDVVVDELVTTGGRWVGRAVVGFGTIMTLASLLIPIGF